MREHSDTPTWTDYKGRKWPVVRSRRRLKFSYPAHAALREHVFVADGFTCRRCGAHANAVPVGWDGRETLCTNTEIRPGHRYVLVADHILTLKAGGLNVIDNLQTLCERCNLRKQPEDIAATRKYQASQR